MERLAEVRKAKRRFVDPWKLDNPGKTLSGEGLAVLHRLDMGAGGEPTGYYDIGDAGVNSAIGGSWPSKITRLKEHARQLQENGCTLMRVRFYASVACRPEHR